MAADTHEIPNKVDRPTAPSSLLAMGGDFTPLEAGYNDFAVRLATVS